MLCYKGDVSYDPLRGQTGDKCCFGRFLCRMFVSRENFFFTDHNENCEDFNMYTVLRVNQSAGFSLKLNNTFVAVLSVSAPLVPSLSPQQDHS